MLAGLAWPCVKIAKVWYTVPWFAFISADKSFALLRRFSEATETSLPPFPAHGTLDGQELLPSAIG